MERAATEESRLPSGPRRKRGWRVVAWLAPALVAGFFLSLRITAVWPEPDVVWAKGHRRFWEDVQLASGYFLRGEFPVYCNDVVKERGPEGIRFTERYPQMSRSVQEGGVETWQFWRTVSPKRFIRRTDATVSKRFDDAGRPLLLGLAFRAMGGIAPFLLLWISFLLLVPVLVWIAWEFRTRGEPWAGSAFLLFTGLSAYVAENLALPYSPSGFYILALYALIALAAYATAPGQGLGAGHWLRVLGAGTLFAVCVLGRGGALLQAGGFVLAIIVAVWRRTERPPGRSSTGSLIPVALSLAVFALPYAAGRFAVGRMTAETLARHGQAGAPQQHALWFGIWGGLGDFDEEKGHVWSDFATWDAIVRAGGTPVTPTFYDPANEAVLRRLVLGEIVQDPSWYAGIVAHRLWATLAQPKLWPWGPTSGASISPSRRTNEGVVDAYYALTSTADWFGVGRGVIEVPVPLLVLPTLALVASSWIRKRPEEIWPLAPLFAAVLPLPVLITTASALEPQSVVVPYMLGAALLVQSLITLKQTSHSSVPVEEQEKAGVSSRTAVAIPLITSSGLEG